MDTRTYTGGTFVLKHYRDGELIDEQSSQNIVTTQGLDLFLNSTIRGGTQISTWYVSLFDSDTTPAVGDTAAQFYGTDGHTELFEFTEVTRPEWTHEAPANGTPSGRMVTNVSSPATFTVGTLSTSAGTVYGAAIISASTASTAHTSPGASDSSATLLAATRFTASRAVLAGDVLKIEYAITATNPS